MGNISYSDAIAIAQVVFYSPALVGSLFVCFRHGFAKSAGWLMLVIFCIARLIGASGQLDTITHPHSVTAWTIALVCSVMGTSPLLLATLGVLSRVYDSIKHAWSFFIQTFVVRIVGLVALVALILAIVGATSVSNPALIESDTEVRVAIVLFLLCYVMILAMALFAVVCTKQLLDEERTLLRVVVLALPLLFVKILYSLLVAFSGLAEFNFVTGSKTIDLCMSVLEEMGIVLLYLYAGLKVQRAVRVEYTPAAQRPQDPREYDSGRQNRRRQRRRRGLIGYAMGAVADAADRNSKGQEGREGSY